MKTVIEMARQAWEETGEGWTVPAWFVDREKSFERLVELVRADERDRMCEQLKECSSEKSTSNEANKSAVLGEGGQAN